MFFKRLAPFLLFLAAFAAVFLLSGKIDLSFFAIPPLLGEGPAPSTRGKGEGSRNLPNSTTLNIVTPIKTQVDRASKTVTISSTEDEEEPEKEEAVEPSEEEDLYKVTRIIDGDTVELEGGIKVRYIGVDTPETNHPAKAVQCFGREAKQKNSELALGKNIRLEKDVSETDRYGRLLRYVYAGDQFVNLELVRQGYAYAATFPPDVKYRNLFREAQAEARENKLGLWRECR